MPQKKSVTPGRSLVLLKFRSVRRDGSLPSGLSSTLAALVCHLQDLEKIDPVTLAAVHRFVVQEVGEAPRGASAVRRRAEHPAFTVLREIGERDPVYLDVYEGMIARMLENLDREAGIVSPGGA